ncbi:hypothetical protein llap_15129 [Limosa lapponica baueri]|uniref:Uncharacterized protein n=1 Tax=Limosa lapponica baueri TaxID=1758121 RepID=A0A2I0TLH4_LIMLA|nr:hypothetical protein llap_15129 [Limosa lapponica baueri]
MERTHANFEVIPQLKLHRLANDKTTDDLRHLSLQGEEEERSNADAPTVNEVANRIRQYEDSLSCPLTVAAVENMTNKMEKMAAQTQKMIEKTDEKNEKLLEKVLDKLFDKLSRMEERFHSSPAWTHVTAIRRRRCPMRPT